MQSVLKGLNEAQQKAVTTIQGPVLIIAGAGSGKTKALTHRVAHLILKGIPPENVLAMTFTNKAAGEMRSRIVRLLETRKHRFPGRIQRNIGDSSLPFIGTFHAFAVRILREEISLLGFRRNFLIYDSDDQIRLCKTVLHDLGLDQKQFHPVRIREAISSLKDELIGPKQFAEQASQYFEKHLAHI
ncbi:MAG: UvrD-helicase domain-containing protein, partial [Parcubacteria group bacterium]|nr:UvrD-helicase domain-containing protein [Parcubacteria group bacterium]